MSRHVLALAAAMLLSALAAGASPAARPQVAPVVPSLEPEVTAALWQRLVERPRPMRLEGDCRPVRGIFYAATDWLRLATKLAANASPCAQYYVSIPPVVGAKTTFRTDQAWRIRALGPSFHALAEFHWTTWSKWVADNGKTWYEAGVEARRRMAEAGFDMAAGDTWAVNELPSSVRSGVGPARTNARELVRGLHDGDGDRAVRGVVFIVGIGQGTTNVGVYQTNLQNWLADQAFWQDMAAYVTDWSQEAYGDFRRYAVPGASIQLRRDYLNDYLQHGIVTTRAGPPTISDARRYLDAAFSPLANAAWQYQSGYGWTLVPVEQMQSFVSAQVYALRSFGITTGLSEDRWGFGWQPRNASGLSSSDFASQTSAVLDRLAIAIRDSGQPGDPADPGGGACGPPGQNIHCGGDFDGAQFAEQWKSFRSWSEPVLAFATPPQTLVAGRPSAPLSLALTTSAGTPQTTAGPLTVTLTSSSPQGRFARGPTGPWADTLSVAIPAGASSPPPVHYLDTHAGTPQISAAAPGATTAAQIQTVEPGPPARLLLTPPSTALEPYASVTVSASGTDAFGNAVAAGRILWAVKPATLARARTASDSTALIIAGGRGGSGRLVAAIGDGVSGTARVTVSPGTIRVRTIRYEVRSSRLRVTARMAETRGAPARAVSTTISVRRNGRQVFTGRKRTDVNGLVTYVLPAARGCYRTTVTGATSPGYRWNGTSPPNRFCSS